jgi:hypothetical protein
MGWHFIYQEKSYSGPCLVDASLSDYLGQVRGSGIYSDYSSWQAVSFDDLGVFVFKVRLLPVGTLPWEEKSVNFSFCGSGAGSNDMGLGQGEGIFADIAVQDILVFVFMFLMFGLGFIGGFIGWCGRR